MRLHPAGRPFVIACGALTAGAGLLSAWALVPGLVLTGLCALFFRDPERVTPLRDGLVVSPADGAVLCVDRAVPPEELNLGTDPMPRIGIFLNVDDVHVNRVPVSGEVIATGSRAGGYLKAWKPEVETHNVRRSAAIRTEDGAIFVVVQLTGFVARRIVSDLTEGMKVEVGGRFGLIRFGSRTDVYMPENAVPLVGIGQRVVGGETVLADRLHATPPDGFRTS